MKKILLFILPILFIWSCSESPTSSDSILSETLLPQVVLLDTVNGYKLNQLTGDSVVKELSYEGYSLVSGRSILLKGQLVSSDSMEVPQMTEANPPRISSNVKSYLEGQTNISVVKIDENLAEKIKLGEGDTSFIVKNSQGIEIPTGVRIKAEGEKKRVVRTKPEPALAPKYSDKGTFDIKYIDEDQGLPFATTYAIMQDSKSKVWIGSPTGGVSVYDGNFFTHYTEKDGFIGRVFDIMEDAEGVIWFATQGGLINYDGEYFTKFTQDKSNLCGNICFDVMQDRKGRIWITCFGGIIKYEKGFFTNYSKKEGFMGFQPMQIIEDTKGVLWIGCWGGGLIKFDGEQFSKFDASIGFNGNVLSLALDKNGDLWMGSVYGGLSKYDGKELTKFLIKPKGKDEGLDVVIDVISDPLGNIFFESTYGISKFDGQSFRTIALNEGLKSESAQALMVDNIGNLWIGTAGDGIAVVKENSFKSLTQKEGLPDNWVGGLLTSKDGHIWSTTTSGLIEFNDENITVHSPVNKNHVLYGLTQDKNDKLWMGLNGSGIQTFDGEKFEYYTESNGLVSNWVNFLYTDIKGNVWIGTADGVSMYDGENFMNYGLETGLVDVRVITMDRDGNMWFGTLFGAIKFDGESMFRYTEKEGLSHNTVLSISTDSEGNIWMGTINGLNKFDGQKFTYFTKKEGLLNNAVRSLSFDQNNDLWAHTQDGISMLRLSKVRKDKPIEVRSYDKKDGVRGIHPYESATGTAFFENNKFWFGSTNGINMLDLNTFAVSEEIPKIEIIRVDINEKFFDYNGERDNKNLNIRFDGVQKSTNLPINLKTEYFNNHFTFYFSGIEWNAQHDVEYSHKVEGLNDEWSTPSKEKVADYRNLPYGSHTFLVRARGENGIWSEASRFTFTIDPPWWHTWWARTLYALSAVLLFLWFVRRRTAKLERRQIELEMEIEVATAEISVQKEEAEIQKDKAIKSEAFKQQFLANMSHEIRTPMNAVMGMTNLVLDTPLQPKQKDYMQGIKKSSDNLLHIINDILDLSKIEAGKMELEEIDFSLSDTIDQVKQTLKHRATDKGLELVTSIKSDLPDVVIGDPVRLNQVLINLTGNAIKFTEKGSVAIEVSKVAEGVKVAIVDTGIGIPADKLKSVFENFSQANASDTRKYGGTGLGLSISRQLVELMGGNISIESEEGSGTTFSFVVNFKEGSAERLDQRMALESSVDGTILDGLKILITDDNEYNRIVARDTLKSKANVEIFEAENGQQAIDLLKENDFDVILMDVQMPIMNGFDATAHIRTEFDGPKKDTPIIALTASVLRTDLDRCKNAGMNSYIPKPFKPQELIVGIAQVLNIELRATKEEVKVEETNTEEKTTKGNSVTDMTYLTDFCEGDESKMKKYIDMFLKSAPSFLDKLSEMTKEKDAEGIANQVHGFNTKLTMMGMTESKSLSIEIENSLRDTGDIESVAKKIEQLSAQIQRGVVELSEN